MFNNLSENLNLLMAKARLNSSELARLTGLPATTIKRIRNNEQSNPTVSTLLPIAQYFSTTITSLLGLETTNIDPRNQPFNADSKLNSIPVLSWNECAQLESLNYATYEKRVFTEKKLSYKSYCLVVEDDDLDFFHAQGLIIVDPELLPEAGDYVIVAKSPHGTAAIKKYIIETDQIYLKSLVKGLGIMPLTSEYKILGVIVQYKVELKTNIKI